MLGPILFLILINSIDNHVDKERVKVGIFADDSRLTSKVTDENEVEKFQHEVNKVYEWETKNNMAFNSDKFELLRYGDNNDLKDTTDYFTPNYSEIIERKHETRDLGVVVSDDLTFTAHITLVRQKVKQRTGWILRSFDSRSPMFMKTIWKTLVLLHSDYCCQVWFTPDNLGEISSLESLQRNFTRRVTAISHQSYWE